MFTNKIPWLVLLFLWMGGSTYWHVCRIKQLCPDDNSPAPTASVSNPTAPAFTVPGLSFSDGTTVIFESPSNASFAKSGSKANLNGVQPLIDSLATYLKANPGKHVQLTGFYDSGEQNLSGEASLGVARANDIRAYLIGLGVPEHQLKTGGESKTDLVFTPAGDSLYGAVQFAFLDEVLVKGKKPTAEEELATKEKFASIFEPMDLYFNTGKIEYIQTAETNAFLRKTKEYLTQHPDQKLVVTGHTDNVGSDALNLMLSKKRAAAVKRQFVAAGIAASQIELQGKGETQPIASNETEAGRKANRRTAIVVNQ
ncbi:OmpA family protein [Larkinella sp. VNQ87]|uniref:OmpA family protein n=1 Tax=Larkinella sp. VNQ87 TaxID=3400921 RepID=UPI003C053795